MSEAIPLHNAQIATYEQTTAYKVTCNKCENIELFPFAPDGCWLKCRVCGDLIYSKGMDE